jgi:hypothetical protein
MLALPVSRVNDEMSDVQTHCTIGCQGEKDAQLGPIDREPTGSEPLSQALAHRIQLKFGRDEATSVRV